MGQSKSKGNIKACIDASLAVMQELAYATERKGKKLGAKCGITCFGCKKLGHLRKVCKNLSGDKKSIPLGPSQCCDKHWRSECKSKSHKDGTLLTKKQVRQKKLKGQSQPRSETVELIIRHSSSYKKKLQVVDSDTLDKIKSYG